MYGGGFKEGMSESVKVNNMAFVPELTESEAYFGVVNLNLANSNSLFGSASTNQPNSLRSLCLIRSY